LVDVLCNPAVQREVIASGAASIHALGGRPQTPSLFGTRSSKPPPTTRNLTVAQLMHTDVPDDDGRCDRIAGYYQAVADREQSAVVLTWCALSIMVMFPGCAAAVAAATPATHAPYFVGGAECLPLEERFVLQLAGSATVTGKTPMEIVLAEWQLHTRLQ